MATRRTQPRRGHWRSRLRRRWERAWVRMRSTGLGWRQRIIRSSRIAETPRRLTINPATLTYVANAASKTYGSANPSLSGSVSGFVNGDTENSSTSGTLAFTTAAAVGTGVGAYTINGSGLSAANYTFQQDSGNATALRINPALLTYTATAASKTYGSANPSLSGSVTGFVNGDTQGSATAGTLAFSTSATSATGVGSYAVNGSGLSATNYTFQQDSGNATALIINPATLTYVANGASKTYGSANPSLSGSVTGFVNGDTENSATAGTLAFRLRRRSEQVLDRTRSTGQGCGRRTIRSSRIAGTLLPLRSIPRRWPMWRSAASKTYGSANPSLAGSVTGFVNGDTQNSATAGTLDSARPRRPALAWVRTRSTVLACQPRTIPSSRTAGTLPR